MCIIWIFVNVITKSKCDNTDLGENEENIHYLDPSYLYSENMYVECSEDDIQCIDFIPEYIPKVSLTLKCLSYFTRV